MGLEDTTELSPDEAEEDIDRVDWSEDPAAVSKLINNTNPHMEIPSISPNTALHQSPLLLLFECGRMQRAFTQSIQSDGV